VAKPSDPVPLLNYPPPAGKPYGAEWSAPYDPETDPVVRQLREIGYKNRISVLEKQVAALGGRTPPDDGSLKVKHAFCVYLPAEFGDWDVKALADVLNKLLAVEMKAKDFFWIEADAAEKTLTAHGSEDDIRSVAAWLKKLKK